eukprot:scaffold11512_cov63-Phaeocystis_antarctica.AAC.1
MCGLARSSATGQATWRRHCTGSWSRSGRCRRSRSRSCSSPWFRPRHLNGRSLVWPRGLWCRAAGGGMGVPHHDTSNHDSPMGTGIPTATMFSGSKSSSAAAMAAMAAVAAMAAMAAGGAAAAAGGAAALPRRCTSCLRSTSQSCRHQRRRGR